MMPRTNPNRALRYYRVAGHSFALHLPCGLFPEEKLEAYAPFRIEEPQDGAALLFTLTVTEDEGLLPPAMGQVACFDSEDGRMQLFSTPGDGLLIHFALPGRPPCCRLGMDSGYRNAFAVLSGCGPERLYGLNNSLMLLYTLASAPHDTLLMHASVVQNGGKGYLFLGKSGTGKSTHSRLWLEHIPGSTLLNDDNPVVRIRDGQAVVYGTPWSGKTPCYCNESAPVGGIVRIRQAPVNRIRRLSPVEAYASLLTSSSGMAWEKELADYRDGTLQRLLSCVPCRLLECLPDAAAAEMCAATVGLPGYSCPPTAACSPDVTCHPAACHPDVACHPEQREGSPTTKPEILHFVQNDKGSEPQAVATPNGKEEPCNE